MRVALFGYPIRQDGAEWTLWATVTLLMAVLVISYLLIQWADRRNARIRSAWDAYLDAHGRLMSAVNTYRGGVPEGAAIIEMVELGGVSMQAFVRVRELAPEVEPDPRWTSALLWVKQKGALFNA